MVDSTIFVWFKMTKMAAKFFGHFVSTI
jgi:hypothetical protein